MDAMRAIKRCIDQAEAAAKEFKENGDIDAEASARARLDAYRDALRMIIASQEQSS